MAKEMNENRIGFIISDYYTPNTKNALFITDSNTDVKVGEFVEIYTKNNVVISALIEELKFYSPKYSDLEAIVVNLEDGVDATKTAYVVNNSYLIGTLRLCDTKYPPIPGSIVVKLTDEEQSQKKNLFIITEEQIQ